MSGAARRIGRRQKRKADTMPIKVEGRGFDLSTLKLTDIDTIELDVSEELLSINLLLPVGDGEAYAEYEEGLDLEESPGYLRHAAREFVLAAARAVRERQLVRGEPLCTTCTSNCCRNSTINLTPEDVVQLRDDGIDMGTVTIYETPSLAGHAGEFTLVNAFDGAGTCCPHLKADGCSIYEKRPTICREYSAWTCSAYVEDPSKKDGKVRLRVVDSAAE